MNNNSFKYTIEPWITTHEREEYTTNIFKVLKRDMKIMSENHEATFAVLDAPDWVNVLPLTPDNDVILVEQYRYGIEKPTLELPGGVCDAGEKPIETAKRELLEETGFYSDEIHSLGKVSSNPAMLTNYTHFYVAKNCIKNGHQELDEHERIHVHIMPVQKFLEMVKSGEIIHSLVVAAVAKFLLSEYR